MSFHVPENQTVSWSVYWPSVQRDECLDGYDGDEVRAESAIAMRCFDRGEPIWMAAAEVKLRIDTAEGRKNYERSKRSPLSLARRVVRM